MKYILLLLFVVILVLFLFNPKAQQLLKVVWLIVQTSPYNQTGSGAGLIVVVGDSTAYGTGVTDTTNSIAGRIGADFPDYEVRTFAKNGRVLGEVIGALKGANLEKQTDVLVLQIGGNDILQNKTKENIEADTRAMLIEAKKYAKHVIFMSCGNVGSAASFVQNGEVDLVREERTLVAREIFMRVSDELQVTYVDLFIPKDTDPFLQSPKEYFSLDGLHPSGAGYGLWYQTLAPVLRSVI